MPSHVTVNLPNGESLSLYANHAVAVYRDGPREPVDHESVVPPFAQRRLGAMRSTSFRVNESTRMRLARLVLHEIDHPAPRRHPRFSGPGPLRVSTFYSAAQTGGESKVEMATRVLPEQESTSALVLRDLVKRLLDAHRDDDSL